MPQVIGVTKAIIAFTLIVSTYLSGHYPNTPSLPRHSPPIIHPPTPPIQPESIPPHPNSQTESPDIPR